MERKPHAARHAVRFSSLFATCAPLLLLAITCLPVSAQFVQGRVLDGTDRQPVANARVILLSAEGEALGDPTMTNAEGVFVLRVTALGEYRLRIEPPDAPPAEGSFSFDDPDGQMEIEDVILPRLVRIEGLDVSVERAEIRRSLEAQGFYARAAEGFGDFISPEDIEERGVVFNVSDYMRGVPGLNFSNGLVLFRSRGSQSLIGADGESLGMCQPDVWIDGTQMIKAVDPRSGEGGSPELGAADMAQSLDDMVGAHEVVAIEIFRHVSSTPIQWGGGSCGTIVIWTRAGG